MLNFNENQTLKESRILSESQYLLFTIGRVTFAVDMEQVAEIALVGDIKHAPVCFHRFHDLVGLQENSGHCPGAMPEAMTSPAVMPMVIPMVMIVRRKTPPTAIIIEEPSDTLSIPLESMRPMPPLIAHYTKAIWAAAFIYDEPVYLVDLYKFGIFTDGHP
ncbi:MAG: hypothetical protein HQK89_06135 [Nitrospirae bacterium]|nr:hypothetical protein [Nitrospirota bacterium]